MNNKWVNLTLMSLQDQEIEKVKLLLLINRFVTEEFSGNELENGKHYFAQDLLIKLTDSLLNDKTFIIKQH